MTGNTSFTKTLFLILFVPLLAFAGDIKIDISVPAQNIGVGQSFSYQVVVSGSRMNLPDLTKNPDFSGFKVLNGPNVSSSVSIVNFNTTAQKTYTWSLLANKVGKYTIASPETREGSNIIRGKAIQIAVSNQPNAKLNNIAQANNGTGQSIALNDHVFLKAIPDKTNPFQGEQVIITYKLYFDLQISSPGLESNEYKDFWVEEFDLGNQLSVSRENYNGKSFQVTTIKKIAAYPTKSGKVMLPQLAISLDVVLPSSRRRSMGLFDDFFDSPFGQRKRVTISSNRFNLNVQPLPLKGKPVNFSGLVGSFIFNGGINKKSAKVNEAITYFLKLQGRGNLYLVSEPEISFSNEFEDYPGNLKKTIDWSKSDEGTVSWEQILIPRSSGNLTIPAYTLNWFDPGEAKYKSETIGPISLKIAGDARRNYSKDVNVVNRQIVESLSKDIRYLKTGSRLFPRGKTFWVDWKFFLILFFMTLSIILSFGLEQYREKVTGNVTLQRQKRAGKQANNRLKVARKNLHEDNEKFFTELEKGVLGFFADRLNLPLASIGKDDVLGILEERSIDSEYIDQLSFILKTAEINRYAPGESDSNERQELLEKATSVLSFLIRRLKK